MTLRARFGSIKAKVVHAAKPTAMNFDHEERAAIHEFDGKLPKAEAERRALEECQHCGSVVSLQAVFRASYGHGLYVCAGCAEGLLRGGWERGTGGVV